MSIKILPDLLQFSSKDDGTVAAQITIENSGPSTLAFKVRVSVQHSFHVTPSDGFLRPGQGTVIQCTVKNNLSVDAQTKARGAKFQVETVILTASEVELWTLGNDASSRMFFTKLSSSSSPKRDKGLRTQQRHIRVQLPNEDQLTRNKPEEGVAAPLPVRVERAIQLGSVLSDNLESTVVVAPNVVHLQEHERETANGYVYIKNNGAKEMAYMVNLRGGSPNWPVLSMIEPHGILQPGAEASVMISLQPAYLNKSAKPSRMSPPQFAVRLADIPNELIANTVGGIIAVYAPDVFRSHERVSPGQIIERLIGINIQSPKDTIITSAPPSPELGKPQSHGQSPTRASPPQEQHFNTNLKKPTSSMSLPPPPVASIPAPAPVQQQAPEYDLLTESESRQRELVNTLQPRIKGSLLNMLVKNVTSEPGNELNAVERQELQAVKASLDDDEWRACLTIARREKKLRSLEHAKMILQQEREDDAAFQAAQILQAAASAQEKLASVLSDNEPSLSHMQYQQPTSPTSFNTSLSDGMRSPVPQPTLRVSPVPAPGDTGSRVRFQDVISHRTSAGIPYEANSVSGGTSRALFSPGAGVKGDLEINMKHLFSPSSAISKAKIPSSPSIPAVQQQITPQLHISSENDDGMGDGYDEDKEALLRTSSLRVESAFMAGQALLNVIGDNEENINCNDPTAKDILRSMMSALEKSRITLDRLVDRANEPSQHNKSSALRSSITNINAATQPISYERRTSGSPLISPAPPFPTGHISEKPMYYKIGGGEDISYPYIRASLASGTFNGFALSQSDYAPYMHTSSSSTRNGNIHTSTPSRHGSTPGRHSSTPAGRLSASALRGIPTPSPAVPSTSRLSMSSNNNDQGRSVKFEALGGIGPHDEDTEFASEQTGLAGNSALYRSALYSSHPKHAEYAAALEERARMETGQAIIRRILVAPGPLVKAFEEFPVRVDAEKNTVDVVWRENRGPGSPLVKSSNINYSATRGASTLRRERFSFDAIYAGPGAVDKLDGKVRIWVRQALTSNRDLNFSCTGCGEEDSAPGLSAPLTMAVGDRGNAGLLPLIVEESFHFLADAVLDNNPQHLYTYRSMASAAAAAASAKQESLFRVTVSSAMMRDGTVVDLLGGSDQLMNKVHQVSDGVTRGPSGQHPSVTRTTAGHYHIEGVRQIQLRSPADLERVVGVLLGKRFAIRDLQSVLEAYEKAKSEGKNSSLSVNDNAYSSTKVEDQIRHLHRMDGSKLLQGILIDSPHVGRDDVTMILTVQVTKSAVGFGQNSTGLPIRGSSRPLTSTFNIVVPCGEDWSTPGHEISMYMEGLRSQPHMPPPSLLRSSMLAQLLLGHPNNSTDHIVIGGVVRNYSKIKKREPKSGPKRSELIAERLPDKNEMILNALHTLRTISNN